MYQLELDLPQYSYLIDHNIIHNTFVNSFWYRSSLPEVFCKNDVHKNFAKVTGQK